jgi:hypothetical protein
LKLVQDSTQGWSRARAFSTVELQGFRY